MSNDSLQKYSFYSLGALRIVAGLLFMQHGLQKYFQYPPGAISRVRSRYFPCLAPLEQSNCSVAS